MPNKIIKELKTYCWKCGRKMDKKYVDMYYEPTTGKQEFNIVWSCPEKRWWNSHAKWKSDKDGDTYSFEA